MATIKLKRGTSAPTTSNIVDGEVAIDKTTQKLYLRDGSTIKEIGRRDSVPLSGGTMTGSLTVGADDTGHDVKFFGATSGSYMLWDESTDDLILGGASRLGVGLTSPTSPLTVKSNSTSSSDSGIILQGNGNTNAIFKVGEKSTDGGRLHMYDGGTEKIAFYTDGTANHISAGKLLVGHSTSQAFVWSSVQPQLQIEGTDASTSSLSITRNDNGGSPPYLIFAKSRGTSVNSNTVVQDDDGTGEILFAAADGTDRLTRTATIYSAVDGTPGSNDTPGRLVFGTTPDGSASPTVALTLDSSQNATFSGTVTSSSTSGGATFIAYRDQTGLPDSGDGANLIGAYLFKSSDTSGSEPHYAGLGGFSDEFGRMELQFFTERDNWDSDPRVPTLTLDRNKDATFAGHIELADSKYVKLGADGDFILYHDGTSNYIQAVKENSDIIFRGNDDGTNANFLTLDTSSAGKATFASDVDIEGGQLTLGKADTNSAHINSYELMTFNVDTDNDDTDRLFEWNKNGNSGGGTELMRLEESGNLGLGSGVVSLNDTDIALQVGSSSYSTPTIQIRSGTSGTGKLWFGDNSGSDAGRYDGYIEYGQTDRDMRFGTASTERMRLDATGLGIGTTSPSSILHLEAAGSPTLRIVDTTNDATLLAYAQDSEGVVGTYSNHNLGLYANSNRVVTIDVNEDVGIGTNSVDAKLHVEEGGEPGANGTLILEANSSSRQIRISPPSNAANGYIDFKGGNLLILDDGTEMARFQGSAESFQLVGGTKLKMYTSDDSSSYFAMYSHTDDSLRINYQNSGNDEFMMTSGGNLSTIGTITASQSNSDIRLKENIQVISDAVSKVKSLRGVTFNFKESGEEGTGLIAQEVQEVLPEAVYTAPPRNEGDDFLALHYGNTVGLLVEAIKEQQTQIETLTKRIKELEDK